MLEYLHNIDIYSLPAISIIVLAGFMVGFINTLAGSGSIISYSLFMMFGLPPSMANGTLRVGVIAQTFAASLTFKKQNILDLQKGLVLAIPIVIGSLIGAQVAVNIDEAIFEHIVGFIMLLMLFFIFYNPKRWVEGKIGLVKKQTNIVQILIFLIIGFYGGFIHIGVGIFLLSALVLNAGYDLVKANAIKVFVVLLYTPFAVAIFAYNDQIYWGLGIILSFGSVIGGIVASRFAVSWGPKFVRVILIAVIILFSAKLFGVYSFLS